MTTTTNPIDLINFDLHGVAEAPSCDECYDPDGTYTRLVLAAMRAAYPGVTFEDRAGSEFNRLANGNGYPVVTGSVDYDFAEWTPEDLEAFTAEAARITEHPTVDELAELVNRAARAATDPCGFPTPEHAYGGVVAIDRDSGEWVVELGDRVYRRPLGRLVPERAYGWPEPPPCPPAWAAHLEGRPASWEAWRDSVSAPDGVIYVDGDGAPAPSVDGAGEANARVWVES